MIDPFAGPDPTKNDRLFLDAIRRKNDGYRLPEDFGRCVAKEPLRGSVPRQNDAMQVLGDDRVVGRLDDGCQSGVFRPIPICRCHFDPQPYPLTSLGNVLRRRKPGS